MVQGPSIGPSAGRPRVLELVVSCFAWAGDIHEESALSSHN
jgi:hypothetical protein